VLAPKAKYDNKTSSLRTSNDVEKRSEQ